jgi:hypothetical protein
VLRIGMALLGRLTEQPRRLRLVLLNALARVVKIAEAVLGARVPLLRGQLEPQEPHLTSVRHFASATMARN